MCGVTVAQIGRKFNGGHNGGGFGSPNYLLTAEKVASANMILLLFRGGAFQKISWILSLFTFVVYAWTGGCRQTTNNLRRGRR